MRSAETLRLNAEKRQLEDGMSYPPVANPLSRCDSDSERDGGMASHLTPTAVPGLTNIVDVVAINRSSYALSADGRLWSWGGNAWGQLGLGDTSTRLVPTEVLSPLAGYRFDSISGEAGGAFLIATLVPVPAPAPAFGLVAAVGFVAGRRRR